MNKKLILLLGAMMIVGCLFSSRSFADQDYQQRNFFNRITDWSVTIGKSSDDRQRIIDERVQMRAKERQAWNDRRNEEKKKDVQKDEENKNYENRRSDVQNQYKDNPDMLNKKLQEVDNDHNAKMNDLNSR